MVATRLGFPPVHVPPEVVSLVVLPPLLYAAGEELPWRDLRAVWRPVTVLAVGLLLACRQASEGAQSAHTGLTGSACSRRAVVDQLGAELIAAGTGKPFAPAGRTFREWVVVGDRDPARWADLIDEARAFASGQP